MELKDKINESALYLNNKGIIKADLAIVLGTGLSSIEEIIEDKICIPYKDIPHFPTSTVEGHKGQMIYGRVGQKHVILLSGRFHFYEGYSMEEVTYYIHVLKSLRIDELIITNASGGLNKDYKEGEIILVKDHINLFPFNPLRGLNDESLGPRFPDMVKAYPVELRDKIKKVKPEIKEGVYLGWQGPSLETPAEYRMAQIIGADVVGMSSVPEVIVAKYRSIPVLMLSLVSNVVDHNHPVEATLEDILLVMEKSSFDMKKLLVEYLQIQE